MKSLVKAVLATGALMFSASAATAAPRISLLYDQQFFCANCGGAFNHIVFKSVIAAQYPQEVDITSIAAPVLAEGLARTDVLFVPFQWDLPMAGGMTPESIAAMKGFVQNGGRIVFKNDYSDGTRHNRDLVEKVFGVRFGAVNSTSTPNYVCDTQKAAELGWQSIPASGLVPFYGNFFADALPLGVIPLCTISGSGVLLAALPFGDGIIYFDGLFSSTPDDFSLEQRAIFREMAESDLVSPHRCFVRDGASKCSGGNSLGQLGLGDKNPHVDAYSALNPVNLGTGFVIDRVQNATGSSCALSMDGRLKCWGLNKDGQLGLGDVRPRGMESTDMGDQLPAMNFSGAKVVDFAVGRAHACALTDDSKLHCWGKGANGQLGSEASASIGAAAGDVPALVNVNGRVRAVRAGRNHTCVLLEDKHVACFGDNSSGQLGVGSSLNVGDRVGTMGTNLRRVDLGTNFDVAQLATGQDFACALSERGQIKCWGANDSGQLGQGVSALTKGSKPEEMGDALPLTDLGEDQVATGLSCGFQHCCALTVQNTMKCWGANEGGQLGIGDSISRGRNADMGDQLPFTKLPPAERVDAMDLVGGTTCAHTESGTRCWGANSTGQLATGDRQNRGDAPNTVPRLLPPLF